jgi:hypothetical protein
MYALQDVIHLIQQLKISGKAGYSLSLKPWQKGMFSSTNAAL